MNMQYLIPVAEKRVEEAKKYNQKWFWGIVLGYLDNWIQCAQRAEDHATVRALSMLEQEARTRI